MYQVIHESTYLVFDRVASFSFNVGLYATPTGGYIFVSMRGDAGRYPGTCPVVNRVCPLMRPYKEQLHRAWSGSHASKRHVTDNGVTKANWSLIAGHLGRCGRV